MRKADFYFKQHNEVIPLAVHSGGRPAEVFVSSWNEAQLTELQDRKVLALMARKKKNLELACDSCPVQDKHVQMQTAAEKFGSSGAEKYIYM